jgi:Xaa-Pro dipeptidase
MTRGVGGGTMAEELARLNSRRDGIAPITTTERQARIAKAQSLMRAAHIDALYLDATSSLYYFTGLRFRQSERLLGAVIPAAGALAYLCPAFEAETLREAMVLDGPLHGWQEHENACALLAEVIRRATPGAGKVVVALDEQAPFFLFDGLRQSDPALTCVNAKHHRALPQH